MHLSGGGPPPRQHACPGRGWRVRNTTANAVDRVRSRPESRTVCRNSTPSAEETNDLRAGSRTTPETGIPLTYGVPSTRCYL
jgi:hypothetical protein